jgi:hypothetical protein
VTESATERESIVNYTAPEEEAEPYVQPDMLDADAWHLYIDPPPGAARIRKRTHDLLSMGALRMESIADGEQAKKMLEQLAAFFAHFAKFAQNDKRGFSVHEVLEEMLQNGIIARGEDGRRLKKGSETLFRPAAVTFGIFPRTEDDAEAAALVADTGDGFNIYDVANPLKLENIGVPSGRGLQLTGYYAHKIGGRINYLLRDSLLTNEVLFRIPIPGEPKFNINEFKTWRHTRS